MSTAENKVMFGISKVAYSLATEATDGSIIWATPVMIPNAQSFTMDRNVNQTPVHADNKLIFVVKDYTGATITLQFSSLLDSVKQALLGYKSDSKGHSVEITNGAPVYFALILQVEGDAKNRRRVFLKCSASQGSNSTETRGDSTNVNSDTLNISVYPVTSGENDIISYDVDSDDTDYATVLTAAPTLPTFTG